MLDSIFSKNKKEQSVKKVLGREQREIPLDFSGEQIAGKTVLITGGGETVGFEVLKTLAARRPRRLLFLNMNETLLCEWKLELTRINPELEIGALIGSVTDRARIEAIFKQYQPNFVIHAALYQQSLLNDGNLCEIVLYNVYGTYNLLTASIALKAESFVLVSTTRAADPGNYINISRRICEMLVQVVKPDIQTRVSAVRLGSILDGRSSYVAAFRKQLQLGGPVMVGHPDLTRYFMTVKEAVDLIIYAGLEGKGGAVLSLDMGEAVFVEELAKRVIQMAGYKAEREIAIQYVGMPDTEAVKERPLWLKSISENGIFSLGTEDFDKELFKSRLWDLYRVVHQNDVNELELVLKQITMNE